MKKILLTITAFLVTLFAVAQSPNLLNYQGVARNAVGNVIPSQPIGLRLSILSGSPTGTPVYTETRNVTTNAFGLFNVQVGSPGAITSTGTIAGINWTAFGVGSGTKFLQVEIDPIGGTNYFNVGSTQLVSVPYALYAGGAAPVGPAGGDLTGTYPNPQIVFPLIKTFNFPATQLIGMTNSSPTGTLGAITGSSASADANADAIEGTLTSATQGSLSAAVRGINLGTGNTGIGVTGSHAASGWGVYGVAPNGVGVNGASTTGTGVSGASTGGVGVAGTSTSAAGVSGTSTNGAGVFGTSNISNAGSFQNTNAANAASTLVGNSNGSGASVEGTNTGTGRGGFFQVLNPASTADAIRAETNGTGASWGIHAISSGTNGAGLFRQTNAANTANNLQSVNAGLGRAGLFVTNNAASAANTLEATNNGSGNALNASTSGTGVAVRISNSNAANTSITTLITNAEAANNAAPNGSLIGVRGAILAGTQFLVSDLSANPLPTAIGGISSAGIGVQGSSVSGFGTAGVSNSGYGVAGVSVLPTGTGVGAIALGGGYALQTQGRLQFTGQGAATNRIMGATNAAGDATWRTAGSLGLVSVPLSGGTLNYVPKFTPDGFTLGNSQVFDNGTNVGIGTVTPNHLLNVGGSNPADAQGVAVRGYSNFPPNWKGSGAFGFTAATVIMGELSGVANIGGHNSNLSAWAPLAINSVPGNNVGIGTAAPAYALDVNHNGATGLQVKSLASFSVIDLNAANGDAALRYQNAGTTRWNVRNAPGSNDYQILRNNGLPANVTINNGTGYVGITQTAPSYQLDVLHAGGLSGASGIRSKSSSDFSVVDIDAADGDAALRLQKAGVGQWNMRNRPSDNYLEIFELGGGGSRMVIQDATGNVGIGETTNPSYRLDVLHDGGTGIRSRSSASFSVVDIDAASGDAALRFQKAGVNMWNTRNRPSDNNYEWFELGGGGSRMVIQRGTGNVGIGQTASPAYKLDVLHSGGTGARIQSSASFSVVDIDAASGDAALRFVKGGINMWNTRNRPSDDNYEWFELGGGGSRMVIQRGTGNVGIGQTGSPSYKLDVLHSGGTGIRVQSSNSFSVVDIDAQNGDAALRFVKAGVNLWNTRNEPVLNDYQWFELGGGGERLRIQRGTGNLGINQPNPAAKLDVNGTFKLTDGTQGAGKVLVSDAAGNASWSAAGGGLVLFSSPWLNASASVRDTTVDGTCMRLRDIVAPELTATVLNSKHVTVYFRVGITGPYQLPYIADAGGATNQINCIFNLGKIFIYRHTFNTCRFNSGIPESFPGQPVLINLPSTLEYRYVITQ